MGHFDLAKAMEQITHCDVAVKIKRLEQHEIDVFSRPTRKRNAKRRYDTLSFDCLNDDRYFEMACEEPTYLNVRRTRKTRKKVNYEEDEFDYFPDEEAEPPRELPTKKESELIKISEQPLAKVKLEPKHERQELEIKPLRIKKEILAQPSEPEPEPVVKPVARLRVKTAAELGSTIVFVDCVKSRPPVPTISFQSAFTSSSKTSNNLSTDVDCKLNIQVISRLYKKFFTPENQSRIRKVAEILQNVAENAERNNEKIQEINNSRSTDAEKLMLRYQAYSDHKRKLEANHAALKEQFEVIARIFDNENFEILFQLFFLGILKIFLVSAPNKKGTLFKRIVSQLSSSLDSSGYKNDRVSSVLKAKQFRDECIALVQFIEKYSETDFFEMLFLSDSDKMRMSKKREITFDVNEKRNLSTNGSFISESNLGNMKAVPCGRHLLLPEPKAVSKPVVVIGNKSNNVLFQHISDPSKKPMNTLPSTTANSGQNIPRTVTFVTSRANTTSSSVLKPTTHQVTVITSKQNTTGQQQQSTVIHKASFVPTNISSQSPRNQVTTSRPTLHMDSSGNILVSQNSTQTQNSNTSRPTLNMDSSGNILVSQNPTQTQNSSTSRPTLHMDSSGNILVSQNPTQTQNSNNSKSPNLNFVIQPSSNLLAHSPTIMVQQDSRTQFSPNITVSAPGAGVLQLKSSYTQNTASTDQLLHNATSPTGSLPASTRNSIVQPMNTDSSSVKTYSAPRTGLISVKKDLMPTTTTSSSPYSSSPSFVPFAQISSNTSLLTPNSTPSQSIGLLNVPTKSIDLNPSLTPYGNTTNNENIMPGIQSAEFVNPITTPYVAVNSSSSSNLRSLLTESSYYNQHSPSNMLSVLPRDQQYFNTSASQLSGGMLYTSKKQGCDYKMCSKEATVVCSGCNNAYYCGNECQKMDWAYGHNATCNMSS